MKSTQFGIWKLTEHLAVVVTYVWLKLQGKILIYVSQIKIKYILRQGHSTGSTWHGYTTILH